MGKALFQPGIYELRYKGVSNSNVIYIEYKSIHIYSDILLKEEIKQFKMHWNETYKCKEGEVKFKLLEEIIIP